MRGLTDTAEVGCQGVSSADWSNPGVCDIFAVVEKGAPR